MDSATGATKARDPKFDQAVSASNRKNWSLAVLLWRQVRDASGVDADRKIAGRRLAEAARRNGDLKTAEAALKAHFKSFPKDRWGRKELAIYLQAVDASTVRKPKFWTQRPNYIFHTVARNIAELIASNASVVADIGSNGNPVLEWFPNVPTRISVDPARTYKAPGVKSVRSEFLDWQPTKKINVLTCFHTLEFAERPDLFAQKMLALGEVCIVSVPYKWSEKKSKRQLHDPIDEAKMLTWFGRSPNYSYIVREISGEEHLICVYDRRDDELRASLEENRFRFRWSLRGAEGLVGQTG